VTAAATLMRALADSTEGTGMQTVTGTSMKSIEDAIQDAIRKADDANHLSARW
jgi:hypothetical protein